MHNDVYILQYKKDNFVVRDGLRPGHRNDESSTILRAHFRSPIKGTIEIRIDPILTLRITTMATTIRTKRRVNSERFRGRAVILSLPFFLEIARRIPIRYFAGRNLTFLHRMGSICSVMAFCRVLLCYDHDINHYAPKVSKRIGCISFDTSRYCHFCFHEIASKFFL